MAIGPRCLRCLMLILSGSEELLFLDSFKLFVTFGDDDDAYGWVYNDNDGVENKSDEEDDNVFHSPNIYFILFYTISYIALYT